MLPQPKPRATREHFVVLSIRNRKIARAQRSGVRHREDALKRLDLAMLGSASITVSISSMSVVTVNRSGIGMSCLREHPAPSESQRFPPSWSRWN